MIEVVLLKTALVGLFGLTGKRLIEEYKEAEDHLHSGRMSWTQFKEQRNAIISAGGASFIFVAFLLAL